MTARAWWWAAGSLVAYILAFVIAAIGVAIPASALNHPASLALWAATWVLLSGLAALVGGRALYRLELRASIAAWAVLVGGAVLNAAFVLTLMFSISARVGYWEPDAAGLTFPMWAVIAAVATAGFGVMVAPPSAAGPPAMCVWFGALIVALIVAFNVPGSLDGIRPESWPLALVMGAVLAYAIGLAVVSVRKVLAEPTIATDRTEG